MLFQIFILIHLCLSLNEAASLKRYPSQTILSISYVPRYPIKVCDCKSKKCSVNEDDGAKLCERIQKRFEFKGNPNQYLMFCEVDPDICAKQTKPKPDTLKVHIIFDTWYFYLAPFYHGMKTGQSLFTGLIESGRSGLSLGAANTNINIAIQHGNASMPYEFSGILNLPATDADKYYYCTTNACIETINKFCDQVVEALKTTNPMLMEKFMGCTVRRIYPEGSDLGIDWSIMINYHDLISSGKIAKKSDIENQLSIMKENLKVPDLLKSIDPYRVVPHDFCEISAESITTQTYFSDLHNPAGSRYRCSSARYYSDIIKQLLAGDHKHPSCFRNAIGLDFSREGKYAQVKMFLLYSLTCYKQRGLKSCQEVTNEVQSNWLDGMKRLHFPMAMNYTFNLLKSGVAMQI